MGEVRTLIAKELHKQGRVNYPRRYVELKGISDLYQADLVEMIPYSRINKGFKYIMTIINCFSKFAIALPLKSKQADEIVANLEPVLKKYPMKHFQTDQGKEWFNLKVKALFEKYNINHYATFSDMKASIVERFNRTLKTKMWRLFSVNGNYKWLELLPLLIDNYNNTIHRTIGLKPIDVNKLNEKNVLLKIVNDRKKYFFKQKFNVGDRVRISRIQKVFTKGYLPRWSNEIFTVWKVQPTNPVTYLLKDDKGEVLKGGFYQEELSKTKIKDTYLIEKVIRKKGDKLLVRWLGFDESHDSWIDKKDLL
jgi:hypothetical protein